MVWGFRKGSVWDLGLFRAVRVRTFVCWEEERCRYGRGKVGARDPPYEIEVPCAFKGPGV